jgi:adenylosuccinate synthase
LELDQDRGVFPFVTRSNTGLKNVLALCAETGAEAVEAIYATRCYRTRHGAGPLAGELPGKPFAGIEDATNAPNAWQGTLRFGWLDLDALVASVRADLAGSAATGVGVTPSFAVNCLDQAPTRLPVIARGRVEKMQAAGLLDRLNAATGFAGGIEGFGPGARDFSQTGVHHRGRPSREITFS